jgi:hypothetical protein
MRRRKCTNVLYIFIMIFFYIFLFALFSVAPGPSEQVVKYRTIPMDSEGNFCGEGKLKDYPKLYFWNMEKPLNSVCVKDCPTFDYYKLMGIQSNEVLSFAAFKKLRNRFFLNEELDSSSKSLTI